MADRFSDFPAYLQPLAAQLQLDANEAAPQELKSFFKLHSQAFKDEQESLIDFGKIHLPGLGSIAVDQAKKAFEAVLPPRGDHVQVARYEKIKLARDPGVEDSDGNHNKGDSPSDVDPWKEEAAADYAAYSFKEIPGLVYLPRLLPHEVQTQLLDRLLHRELFNPAHKTNLHAHYDMVYPSDQFSHFATDSNLALQPKDPTLHSNLTMGAALGRKLRWMTLGGQYNWTSKTYPPEPPPEFPKDIASLIHHLFPDIEPQAAIVNIYSPGDKLNMHRDISEEVDQGLLSISLGCSCIFVIGLEDPDTHKIQKLAIRLRSGDVLYMTGESRLAWHGVSRVEKNTCPKYLQAWPGERIPQHYAWLENKRINLNVRQMREAKMQESDYSTTRIEDEDYAWPTTPPSPPSEDLEESMIMRPEGRNNLWPRWNTHSRSSSPPSE